MTLIVRNERAGEEAAISSLVRLAFASIEHSDGSEPAIVERLRKAGALTLSLVAEADGEIAGYIAFSPVAIDGGAPGWYGLGPLAVAPRWQGHGVGTAVAQAGLAALRESGAQGCVVLGDPAYYVRFGFSHDPQLAYPGPPPEYFQCLRLAGPMPAGIVHYHAAFGA